MVIGVCGLLAWTRDPLTRIRIPAKEISAVSVATKGASRLTLSDIPNIHHKWQFDCRTFDLEEAAKDRSKLVLLLGEFDKQLSSSSLRFYISATPARSHLAFLFHSSRVSRYSWIITFINVVAMTTILFLSCYNKLWEALNKLLE